MVGLPETKVSPQPNPTKQNNEKETKWERKQELHNEKRCCINIWRNHPRGVSYNYLFEKLPSLSKKRIYKAVFNLKGYGNSVTEKIDGTTYIFQKESSK